jgi:3'-phosphoadenosine 5'-phosphosulfate sulfotransferase (PAPS reductase)/FAD synthetase
LATIAEALASIGTGEYRHIVSLSGGKDSTALALYLRDTYPHLRAEYVFCDTGAELPETYEYLDRLEALLGSPIVRLSALDDLGVRQKTGRTAFDIYLREVYGGFLPNPRSRWCTRVLKIQPFERYVGESKAFSYIGIRADENRQGYVGRTPPVLSQQPNILPVYPLREAGFTLADVNRILERSGLGLPQYYAWRSRSGCYFCFYQQAGEWQRLSKVHPDLFQRAAAYEKPDSDRPFTWVAGRSVREIAAAPRRELPDPDATDSCTICHL